LRVSNEYVDVFADPVLRGDHQRSAAAESPIENRLTGLAQTI
jgi:hypothetical protein